MYEFPFVSYVDYDSNRASDGLRLRDDFVDEIGAWVGEIPKTPCNMLELTIALGKRFWFEIEGFSSITEIECIWMLLNNIGLDKFTDDYLVDAGDWREEIYAILDRVVERRYNSNGQGGFFPLENPTEDQRRVELWGQMSAFCSEMYDFKTDI